MSRRDWIELKTGVENRSRVVFGDRRVVEARHENQFPLKLNHLNELKVPIRILIAVWLRHVAGLANIALLTIDDLQGVDKRYSGANWRASKIQVISIAECGNTSPLIWVAQAAGLAEFSESSGMPEKPVRIPIQARESRD